MRLIWGSLFMLMLAACETPAMTKKQCLAGDWYAAGFEDGANGLLETNFDARAGACYEHDAGADFASYREGRAQGLAQFCTPAGGYSYGLSGRSYLGVCLAEDEPAFLGAYLEGWRIHRAEAAREVALNAYNSAISSADYHRGELRRARQRLDDPEATEKQIKKARKDMDYHRREISSAESDIDRRLYELGRADEALEQTRRSMAAWRTSEERAFVLAMFLEAQALARAEDAIDFCTDDVTGASNLPWCEINAGAILRDSRTGAACAAGPAKAALLRRGGAYGPFAQADIIQVYQVFRRDDRGRAATRPESQFVALFDDAGAYLGASCPAPQGAP